MGKLKRAAHCCTALMICALAFAGCGQPQQKVVVVPISVPDTDKAEVLEVAEDVLARMHFTIEKADVPSGLIRTRPLPGAQFFELWRSDNVGDENSLLANLHTIRRTVELDVSRHGDQLQIDCDVRVQRLSLPERDVSSSARVYAMFTRSSPSRPRMSFDVEQRKDIAWIDLEDDTALAARILKRIERRLASRAGGEPPATESRT
ncbi:MAG: hypothetical protein ACYTBS_01885 [Planctomycetota bacterium]